MDSKAEDFILDISNSAAKILLNYMEKFKLLNQKITYELAVQLCTNILCKYILWLYMKL